MAEDGVVVVVVVVVAAAVSGGGWWRDSTAVPPFCEELLDFAVGEWVGLCGFVCGCVDGRMRGK